MAVCKMQDRTDAWERLIDVELLQTNLVSGVALVTHKGECVYNHGTLGADITSDTWKPFTTIFERATPKHEEKICKAGFSLSTPKEKKHFIRKTLSSLYGTSAGGTEGLVVCNLPYGVFICVHLQPDCAGRVTAAVERFADILRT